MSNIEFVSHESYPEDQYTKEAVTLQINGFRLLYIRKESKTGGKFWSIPSVTVTRNGEKEHLKTFMQDSSFLDQDIKDYLDKRKWEKVLKAPVSTSSTYNQEEIPF